MTIERFGVGARMSRAVAHANTVYVAGQVADNPNDDVAGQTRQVLAKVEVALAEAGTDKSKLLTATVYITDMAHKPEMDAAWRAWVDPANPPQRACVAVTLEGRDLVEIVVTAAA